MSYSKQTWTNDVSKLNATRLAYIEDGIEAAAADADSAQVDAAAAVVTADAIEARANATQQVFNVTEYASVQAAVNAASASGGVVYFPQGTYNLTSQVVVANSGVVLKGAGPSQTIITQGSGTGNILIQGSEGSAVNLNANATAGDTTLTLTSTSGLAANDFLSLYSAADWPNTTNSSKQGEIVRVKSVDSGTVITLWGRIEDSYTTSNTGAVRKLSLLDGIGVFDLTIRNPTPATLALPALNLKWLRSAAIRNCTFDKIDGQGVTTTAVIDSHFDNLRFYDLTDDTANSRFGYGVAFTGPSQNNVASNLMMRGGRHCVTHGGSSRGIPRHNRTCNSRAVGMTAAAFDTHVESSHNTFSDCEVWGQFGSSEGYGFSLNGPYSTLIGCKGGYLRQSVVAVNDDASNAVILGCQFGPLITGQNAVFNQGASTSIIGCLFQDIPSTAINNDASGAVFVDESTRFVNCATPVGGTTTTGITWNQPRPRRAITYSASMTPDGRAWWQVIPVTNNTAFTVNNPANPQTGQTMLLEIRNTIGGAGSIGTVTWGSAYRWHADTAPVMPADTFRIVLTLGYTGTHWVQLCPAATGIPNS